MNINNNNRDKKYFVDLNPITKQYQVIYRTDDNRNVLVNTIPKWFKFPQLLAQQQADIFNEHLPNPNIEI